MATPLPIVCSLDAAGLRDRVAEMAAIGAAGLVASEVDGRRGRLRFRAAVAGRLETVVAAERECCAWLGLDLARHGDELQLTLIAPPGGEAAMAEFAAAFGGRSAALRSR
jgi:hypothetical protein